MTYVHKNKQWNYILIMHRLIRTGSTTRTDTNASRFPGNLWVSKWTQKFPLWLVFIWFASISNCSLATMWHMNYLWLHDCVVLGNQKHVRSCVSVNVYFWNCCRIKLYLFVIYDFCGIVVAVMELKSAHNLVIDQ